MGVVGYVFKTATPDQMIEAFKRIAAGGTFFPEQQPNK
jgi:DNA-binding NarL/FixJ family response regulator